MLEKLELNFLPDASGQRLLADGEDITGLLRTPEVSMLASAASPAGGAGVSAQDPAGAGAAEGSGF